MLSIQAVILLVLSFALAQSRWDSALATAMLVQYIWPFYVFPAIMGISLLLFFYSLSVRSQLHISLLVLQVCFLVASYLLARYSDLTFSSWALIAGLIPVVLINGCIFFTRPRKVDNGQNIGRTDRCT